MLGAGLFTALGVATSEAGSWVLLSWGIAGVVAACCATSSIRLSNHQLDQQQDGQERDYPEPKITNLPPLKRLAHFASICSKIAACGVLVLTIHEYLFPDIGVWLAAVIAVCLLLVNLLTSSGLPNAFLSDENATRKSAIRFGNQNPSAASNIPSIVFNRLLVAFILLVLAFIFMASSASRQADLSNVADGATASWGIVTAAGLLFFAFGGYSHTASFSSRVKSPKYIMWATAGVILLASCVAIMVSLGLLSGTPAASLAASNSPFVVASDVGGFNRLSGLIRLTAFVACLSVLMPLLKSLQKDLARTTSRLWHSRQGNDLGNHEPATTNQNPHPDPTPNNHKPDPTPSNHKYNLVIVAVCLIGLVLFVGIRPLLSFSVFCLLILGATECVRAFWLPKKPLRQPSQDTLENRIRIYNQLPPRTPTKRQQARLAANQTRLQSRSQAALEVIVRAVAATGIVGCLVLAFSLPLVNIIVAACVLAGGTLLLGSASKTSKTETS